MFSTSLLQILISVSFNLVHLPLWCAIGYLKNYLHYGTLVVFSADTSSELTASKKKIGELEALCASQDLEVSTYFVYSFILLIYRNKSARE
jgi:hypothetical protein